MNMKRISHTHKGAIFLVLLLAQVAFTSASVYGLSPAEAACGSSGPQNLGSEDFILSGQCTIEAQLNKCQGWFDGKLAECTTNKKCVKGNAIDSTCSGRYDCGFKNCSGTYTSVCLQGVGDFTVTCKGQLATNCSATPEPGFTQASVCQNNKIDYSCGEQCDGDSAPCMAYGKNRVCTNCKCVDPGP